MPRGIYKRTEEHKKKISLSKLGKPSSVLGKHWKIKDTSKMKGHIPWLKGKKGLQSWHNISGLNGQNGNPPWNKGKIGQKYPNRKNPPPFSEEHKRKIGLNGFHYGMKGKHHSEETKRKLREASSGEKSYWFGKKRPEIGKIIRKALLGKPNYKNRGEKSNFWKGGITPLRSQIYNSFKWRLWRSDIFLRDNYTCQKCNTRGGELEAHHIKAFAKIIEEYQIKTLEQALDCEELWNINNGITLCRKCHKGT